MIDIFVRRELRQRNKEVTEKEEDHSYDKRSD